MKRAMDHGAVSLVMILLTSPFMVAIAVLIKCYDGGPVLYRQARLTKDKQEISGTEVPQHEDGFQQRRDPADEEA